MYRIQAYNAAGDYWVVKWASNMTERDEIVNALVASGYNRASIGQEWLARKGY
jgi:hypothetical protein